LASFGCFWGVFGAFWADFGLLLTPLGVLRLPLGAPWAPCGSLWPAFGDPLAILWHLWDPFGGPWVTGVPHGCILDLVENWTLFSKQMLRFHDTVVQNHASPDSPGTPATPAVPGKVVSGTAAATPCPHASAGLG